MKQMKRLNDVFPDWAARKGIFLALHENIPSDMDIWTYPLDAQMLDLEYHGNRSGGKVISPLLDSLVANVVDDTTATFLANVIAKLYLDKWEKIYATYHFEYDPISNYDMVEVMTDDTTVIEYGKMVERADDLTHTKGGTETVTPDLTETESPNRTDTATNQTYGFNSSDPVNSEKQTISRAGSTTTTREGTSETEYDLTESDGGTQTHTESGEDTHTRNYTLTRKGNIGVTTAQQMIEQERALWIHTFIETVIFPDLDRVLTIPLY